MSLRMPQNLNTSPRPESGASVLEAELQWERAAALGRLGRDLERALERISGDGSAGDERALIDEAAAAVWRYFVQRETCGLLDHRQAIIDYVIPAAVLARVGAVT